jgi:hypothetical protein
LKDDENLEDEEEGEEGLGAHIKSSIINENSNVKTSNKNVSGVGTGGSS